MKDTIGETRNLIGKIHWLRLLLPPIIVIWVLIYQLGFAQSLEAAYGHTVHYTVEIAFYSVVGPLVTWIALTWIERRLWEKHALEKQIKIVEQKKQDVLEEERARISRDLHDGVAQTLYFLALKSDGLRQRLAGDQAAIADLKDIGRFARRGIRDIRQTILALQPIDWSQEGLWPSIRHYVEGFAEQMNWAVAMDLDRAPAVPSTLEPTIFRLIQESLTNIAKHAEAHEVVICVDPIKNGMWLSLTIEDDGHGFKAEKESVEGFGIGQMRARVASSGGVFDIQSSPPKGTVVWARLPVSGDQP